MVLNSAELDLVAQVPLLAGLSSADLTLLMDGAHAVAYPETELLFSQGDKADRFFILLEGRVNVFALTETGDQSIIEVFDPVVSFAEAAIFSSGIFPLNAEVMAGSKLVHVPSSMFLKRLTDNRSLGLLLLSGLSQWQFRLAHEISELKSKSPGQRLATFLLALAAKAGADVSGRVRLPLTKAVLASRIGIAPESLSRALNRLKAFGVETHGREVEITDIEALRRMVREGSGE
jgi:CRP-like cAMP-binding protein